MAQNKELFNFMYPTLFFNINMNIEILKKVLTKEKYINIICDDSVFFEEFKIINKKNKIIVEDIINFLDDTIYFPLINTTLVDIIKVNDDTYKLIFE